MYLCRLRFYALNLFYIFGIFIIISCSFFLFFFKLPQMLFIAEIRIIMKTMSVQVFDTFE